MVVSSNRGTPQIIYFVRISLINHPFWGILIDRTPHMVADWTLSPRNLGSQQLLGHPGSGSQHGRQWRGLRVGQGKRDRVGMSRDLFNIVHIFLYPLNIYLEEGAKKKDSLEPEANSAVERHDGCFLWELKLAPSVEHISNMINLVQRQIINSSTLGLLISPSTIPLQQADRIC